MLNCAPHQSAPAGHSAVTSGWAVAVVPWEAAPYSTSDRWLARQALRKSQQGAVLLSPVGDVYNPGLTTFVNATSVAGAVQEALFTYQISGSSYVGSSATLSNSSETGDGAVTGLKNFCSGGSFSMNGISGCTGIAGALVTVDGAQNVDSVMFRASSLLSVTDDLTVDGGQVGTAKGATLVNQFTATPEPMSFWLAGIGLVFAASRVRVRNVVFRNIGRSHE